MGRTALDWLGSHYLEIILAALTAAVIYVLLGVVKRTAARFVAGSDELTGIRTIFLRAIARTSRFFRVMVAAELVITYAEAPGVVSRVVNILFTIAVVWQVAIWIREIVLGLVVRRTAGQDEQGETLRNAMTLIRLLVSVVIFAIASIVTLDNLGFNVTGLVAGLGVGGIAIGLAAQGIFSDLFAALSIIFDKPFATGDTISFDTFTGVIEKIGLKSTRIRSVMGEEIIVSNTNLLGKEITNLTRLNRRRTRFAIGLVYHTPADKALALPDVLKELVEAHDGVLIRSGFTGFGDSALQFVLDFDILSADFEEVFTARHRIGLAVYRTLHERGYEFAYPTQTTYTAAPDGMMIMPYAPPALAKDAVTSAAGPEKSL